MINRRLHKIQDTPWMNGQLNNQPIRANKALVCEIGFAKYLDAKAAWLAV